jgi:hypothetical protein
MNEIIGSHVAPQVPARSTSLTAPTTYEPYNIEPISRAAKKKMKTSASSLNRYTDPDAWWFANDELARIDLDEAVQQFDESKRLFAEGRMSPQEWDRCQVKHLNGIAALRDSLASLQKERCDLLQALSTNYHLSPEPSKNFVSLLLEFLEGQETRSSKLQSEFRKQLLEVHRGWDEQRAGIFCPVVGRFMNPERVKAAHIYPFVLGTTVMRMIFGEQAVGELFHVHNGLLLSDSVEKRFDKHQVVIVPAYGAKLQADGTIDRWVLKLVDDAVQNIPVSDVGIFADLHGRGLQFRTTARPAARYVYFHYLFAMLRMRKHGRKFFRSQKTDDHVDIESRPIPWGTPSPYIQERMVRALIAEAGHDVVVVVIYSS